MIHKIVIAIMMGPISLAVALAQSIGPEKPVARINGDAIKFEEVTRLASAEIEDLHAKRVQAEAGFAREEHSIYDRAIASIVDSKLIDAEAKKLNLSPEVFLVTKLDAAKLAAPTDEEVNAFWEANNERIKMPRDQARPQIRAYLAQQKRNAAYEKVIEQLRAQYNVELLFEPLRTVVDADGAPSKGASEAKVTIIEFADFECPFCAQLFRTLQQIATNYGNRVRFVFRQFPLVNIHPHAQKAAEASLCAFEQNKFWEFHDAMFKDNKNLASDDLKKLASLLMLDTSSFNTCLDTGKYSKAIAKDVRDGNAAGVGSTPTLFINGRFIEGNQPLDKLAGIIDEELAAKKNR